MRPTPYVASLRIYEPLSAFEPADRLRWQSLENDPFSFNREEELSLHRVVQPEPPAGRPEHGSEQGMQGENYLDVDVFTEEALAA